MSNKKTVLLVDDNSNDRKILSYNFDWHGYTAIEAENGAHALDILQTERPRVIVSDALMPVMDGFHLLKAVRDDASFDSIPFIFYSAVYTGHLEEELARELGAQAFIPKPKDPDEFWSELGRALIMSPPFRRIIKVDDLSDLEYYKRYSSILALKLEEKVHELAEMKKQLIEKAKASV
jgi:CheY-like chemotaxis protein